MDFHAYKQVMPKGIYTDDELKLSFEAHCRAPKVYDPALEIPSIHAITTHIPRTYVIPFEVNEDISAARCHEIWRRNIFLETLPPITVYYQAGMYCRTGSVIYQLQGINTARIEGVKDTYEAAVEKYMEWIYCYDSPFPPIMVAPNYRDGYRLLHGSQRTEAAFRMGEAMIMAWVQQGAAQ